ncbi:hypothetical protein BDW02DRAFT_571841 [Decorospora gaudefroyi]|uniref:Uncharacterized protein n=1 Tax=Decorospora gaudefroyi TaxID=184978 RepID=A0A6A5K6F0_9PLEO|nr:hypothetical protein BDW02DRAFT_571841 [Decorospora gaudefroyi]
MPEHHAIPDRYEIPSILNHPTAYSTPNPPPPSHPPPQHPSPNLALPIPSSQP